MPHDPVPDPQVPPSYTVEGRLGRRWWTWQRFAEHDDAARAIAALIESRRFDAIRLLETLHRVGRPPAVLRELFHYDPDLAPQAEPTAAPEVVPVAAPEAMPIAVPVEPPLAAIDPLAMATAPEAPVQNDAGREQTPEAATEAPAEAPAAMAAEPAAPPAPAHPVTVPAVVVPAVAGPTVAAPPPQAPLMSSPAARAVADAFARMEAEISEQERRAQERRASDRRAVTAAAASSATPSAAPLPTAADIWPALWQATVPLAFQAQPSPTATATVAATRTTPAARDAFDDTAADDYAPLAAAVEPAPPPAAAAAPKPAAWDAAEIDAAMAALRSALREVEAIPSAVAAPASTPPEMAQPAKTHQPAPDPRDFTASDRPSVAPANDDAARIATDAAAAAGPADEWDEIEAPQVARRGQWRFRLRRVGYALGTTAAAVLLAIAGYETTRLALGLPDLLGEARHVVAALTSGPERPIVAAARRGDGAEVERLLKGGFSADSEDPQGVPALLVAARAGHADIVRALLDAGGDPNRRFGQADTPILAATREGLLPAVDAMLTRGGQVNGRGGADDCETPLLVAAAAGRLEMVTFLLGRGATFDVLPGCRRGPLDAAAPHPRVRDALENAYQRRMAGVPRVSPVAPAVATAADLAPPPLPAAAPAPLAAAMPKPAPAQPPGQSSGHSPGQSAAQPAMAAPAEPRGYAALMYGLDWRDTLAEVKAKAKECRALGRRYEVCTLAVKPLFDDVAAVEAWFDRADGDRFVTIETRSIDLVDYTAQRDGATVRRRFDELRREIERLVPAGVRPVVQRTAPPGSMTFFEGLKPDVAAGDYSAFWSDDSRRRPASVHLKLGGIDNRKGFYRIVVANPLRQTQQAAMPARP